MSSPSIFFCIAVRSILATTGSALISEPIETTVTFPVIIDSLASSLNANVGLSLNDIMLPFSSNTRKPIPPSPFMVTVPSLFTTASYVPPVVAEPLMKSFTPPYSGCAVPSKKLRGVLPSWRNVASAPSFIRITAKFSFVYFAFTRAMAASTSSCVWVKIVVP